MKKIILLAALFLGTMAQAQVISVLTNVGDNVISNGEVFTFETLGATTAQLDLIVENVSNSTIHLKLRMDSVENAANITETGLQFCFGGQCYFTAAAGDVVPNLNGSHGLTLAPGMPNEAGDHFFNAYAGDNPNLPVVYHMSFVPVDATTGAINGDPLLSFTYKYAPVLSVNEFTSLQNIGITVKNTVVKNQMDVTANQNATVQLYNINGQLVKTAAIANGTQSVDLSSLSTAVYIARFTTEENKTSQIRIVKN